MEKEETLITGDGSHTVVNDRFGVPYHSTHGAITESQHVFIQHGLLPALEDAQGRPVRILEMGFGTGLNALLTMITLEKKDSPGASVVYYTYEAFPVSEETVKNLNFPEELGISSSRLTDLHNADWGEPTPVTAQFSLEKYHRDFITDEERCYPEGKIDVIYYDAFAPNSQPAFWEGPALDHCYRALRPGGWLTTYCAKGQFKRNLRAAGFTVEGVPGPPGKREMTIARK